MVDVMLNTNIYGRLFDDIRQWRILEEADASYNIFLFSTSNLISVKISDVLLAEIAMIKDKTRREAVMSLAKNTSRARVTINDSVISLADELLKFTNDYMDALHIASACFGNCLYLITCDDELTDKSLEIETYLKSRGFKVFIRNPVEFVKEIT